MRNIIVHRYNKIKLYTIKEGVDGIDSLINIGLKISG